MNDQLKELGQKALKHINLVATIALMLLLVLSGLLYFREKNAPDPELPDPQSRAFTVKLPVEDFGEPSDPAVVKAYEKIEKDFRDANPDIGDDEKAIEVIRDPPFERKSERPAAEIAAENNRKYQEAESLYKEGKRGQALRLLNEILATDPNSAFPKSLKAKIEAETPK